MPGNRAWQKPSVNKKHKAAVQQQAQAVAAAAFAGGDDFHLKLRHVINISKMPEKRKADALRAVDEACGKLAAGNNPLLGLNPPPGCALCKGEHGAHHFLCLGRERQPKSSAEYALRQIILRKLNAEWSTRRTGTNEVRSHNN